MENNPIFYNKLPFLDLHGEIVSMVYPVLKEFLDTSILSRVYAVKVIHGIGSGALKEEVHRLLAIDRRVKKFYLNNLNLGETIIELKH
jgi:DNA mismatch repair protein MutS2